MLKRNGLRLKCSRQYGIDCTELFSVLLNSIHNAKTFYDIARPIVDPSLHCTVFSVQTKGKLPRPVQNQWNTAKLRSRVAESEVKCPTPTLPKFWTLTHDSDYSDSLREWSLPVNNFAATSNQRKSWYTNNNSVSVSFKKIVPFQQEFPTLGCDVKNYSIGLPGSKSDKKSDSDTDS